MVPIKYDIVDGIKTGYTTSSKNNLVTTAQREGIRLISVVLKSDSASIYTDSRSLLDYGFESFKYHSFTFAGNKILTLPVEGGTREEISLYAAETVTGLIDRGVDIKAVEEEILLEEITLPLEENQVLGRVVYRYQGQLLGETTLVSDTAVEEKTFTKILKDRLIKRNGLGEIEFRYYGEFLLELLTAFLIWRTVVTLWRLHRLSKKRRKKGNHAQS
jgi:D-alanyl-D-alanine carboxypeptidase (penicillin-binding protein 5/6)